MQFPFLFGGTFIEALTAGSYVDGHGDFPSFSEGLSLRRNHLIRGAAAHARFPFLFGGTFIEAQSVRFLDRSSLHFPSFSEGLSLRQYPP